LLPKPLRLLIGPTLFASLHRSAQRSYQHADKISGVGQSYIDLAQSTPMAHHLCPPDEYHVAYDFVHWPDWTAYWQVAGPRKSYDMRSCYRKTHR